MIKHISYTCLVAALLLLCTSERASGGQQDPGTAVSFDLVRDTVDLGKILVGGEVMDSIVIVNVTTGFTPVLDFVQGDTLSPISITFLDALPQSILPGDTVRLRFLAMSRLSGPQTLRFVISDGAQDVHSVAIRSEGIDTTAPGTVFGLRYGTENILAFRTTENSSTIFVTVKNTGSAELVIQSFRMDESPVFTIEDVPVVPLILDPGSEFTFEIYFNAKQAGFYRTTIRLPIEGSGSGFTIDVQGLKLGTSSVRSSPGTSGIRLIQTPGHIIVKNNPFDNCMIELFDVLGRKLNSVRGVDSEIIVPIRDAAGSPLHPGNYLFRISNADGGYSETFKVMLASY